MQNNMSRNIVVTGTSRGIGLELVKQLAAAGHKVLALTRNAGKLAEWEMKYEGLRVLEADITSENGLQLVHELVARDWKKVDVLIHNAGMLIHKPFFRTSLEDMENVYRVNVFSVAQLTRKLLSHLHRGSHVVAISSMGGIQGSMKFAGLSAYSSSKGALITLMELLAEEYKESGVSFNTLALGAVQTEMLEEAFPGYQAPVTAEDMARYIAEFALNGNRVYNGKVLPVSKSTP